MCATSAPATLHSSAWAGGCTASASAAATRAPRLLHWPVYRLTGGAAFGLHLATVVSNVAAVALAVGIAYRRRGPMLALGVAAALAVLLRGAGVHPVHRGVEPVPPDALVGRVHAGGVVGAGRGPGAPPRRGLRRLVLHADHISYVGLVPGWRLAVGALVVLAVKQRRDQAALVRLGAWAFGSFALGLLHGPRRSSSSCDTPSNLSVIRDSFAHPSEPSVGLGEEAVRLLVSYLDPWGLLSDFRATDLGPHDGVRAAGLAVLVLWAVTAVIAWRRRAAHPEQARLHLGREPSGSAWSRSAASRVRYATTCSCGSGPRRCRWRWPPDGPWPRLWREHRPAPAPRGTSGCLG